MASQAGSASPSPPSSKRRKRADISFESDPEPRALAAAVGHDPLLPPPRYVPAFLQSSSLEVSARSPEVAEVSCGMDSGFSDGDTQAASGEDSQGSFPAKFGAYSTTEEEEDDSSSRRSSSSLHHFPSSFDLDLPQSDAEVTPADLDLQNLPATSSGQARVAENRKNEDEEDRLSEISGLSELSGADWKPNAGPFSWVQHQMMKGTDPRVLLQDMISADSEIPENLDQLTLWKIILNMLSEPPRRKKLDFVNTIDNVASLIKTCKKIVILTGAGVSVSCGIPDFRSRDGVYARLAVDFPDLPDPQAMFDIHYFRKDPRPFFKFAREIYPGQFKPSPCHRFIRNVEKQGKLLRNYTQNIDTLEQVAGIQRVIQCHGSFATATCTKCKHKVSAEEIKKDIFEQRIPYCPVCPTLPKFSEAFASTSQHNHPSTSSIPSITSGGDVKSTVRSAAEMADADKSLTKNSMFDAGHMPATFADDPDTLTGDYSHHHDESPSKAKEDFVVEEAGIMKPDIIFFGEGLGDEFHGSVAKDKNKVDLLIMIGSSLKVRPVALIPSSVPETVPQILINREPLSHLSPDVQLLGDCDAIVNQLCLLLGEEWGDVVHRDRLQETLELLPKPEVEAATAEQCPSESETGDRTSESGSAGDAASTKPPPTESDAKQDRPSEGTSSNITAVNPASRNSSGSEDDDEDGMEVEDDAWMPTRRESLALRLQEGTYFFQPPCRYVFPGAEVFSDDEEDSDDDSSDDSADDDDEKEEQDNSSRDSSSSSRGDNSSQDDSSGSNMSLTEAASCEKS